MRIEGMDSYYNVSLSAATGDGNEIDLSLLFIEPGVRILWYILVGVGFVLNFYVLCRLIALARKNADRLVKTNEMFLQMLL
jgi:hypothetical protein